MGEINEAREERRPRGSRRCCCRRDEVEKKRRRLLSLSSLHFSSFLFQLLSLAAAEEGALLGSFLPFSSLSPLGCTLSSLLFPIDRSKVADGTRKQGGHAHKKTSASIHSFDAEEKNADSSSLFFLAAGQRRVFLVCSLHLALDGRGRHAAPAE